MRQTKRSPLSQQGKRRVHDLFLGVDERPYSVKDRRHLSIFNSQELFWPEKANSCLMGTLREAPIWTTWKHTFCRRVPLSGALTVFC